MAKKKVEQVEEVVNGLSLGFDHELFEATLKKAYGSEALQSFTDADRTIPSIPSSSDTLNTATGNGGIPIGRVIEIFGPESSGKSTVSIDYAIQAQKLFPDRPVVYIDAENAFDLTYAENLGLDTSPERFKFCQIMVAEDALNIVHISAQSNAAMVIVDSVPSLVLRKDIEEHLSTDERTGGIAKAVRTHLKKLTPVLGVTGCTALYINHITSKIGVVYGNPETTPAGTGLKFYSSIRMDVRRKEVLVDTKTGEPYGIKVSTKIVKNKVAPPLKKAEYDIIFGKGIDRVGGLIDAAADAGVLIKAGAWIKLGDQKFNGRAALKEAMLENPLLEEAVREGLQNV
jgi:recombination protein RecA